MIKHWVALSGGVDSCVLLHFLATHFPNLSLHAIHINHGLHPLANDWQKHCHKLCQSLSIPLRIVSVQIHCKKGESLEARARVERYQAFAKIIKKDDVIVTAHHLDDQAETLLLQLLRGAGLRGVAAMPAIAHFANGYLIRPLLNFSRVDIEHYANAHQIHWIEDTSNNNQQFDRNYLRQTIFPILKKRWPQAHKILARFAKHCAEQEHLIESIAAQDYRDCHGEYLNTLSIPALLKYDTTRLNNILRFYIHNLQLPSPPEKLLRELNRLFHAKRDATPVVHWNNVYFRRYKEHLFTCR
jgi:tRNA(Ile)-lysidine synthase